MSGWWFAHPAALWMLLALPFLWWRARAGRPAAVQWTGSLALWRRALQPQSLSGARSQRGVPWSLIAGLLAAVLAIVALADPQHANARTRNLRWSLILDRSASMFLPVSDAPAQTSRIERAVELAVALCEKSGVEAAARDWITYGFDGVHASPGARPPTEWLAREWGPGIETPWQRLDTPAHVWISDCKPDSLPLRAGLVHAGAAPIHGPIADLGARCLTWDGEQFAEQDWSLPRTGLFLAKDLPTDVATLASVWAQERHLSLVSEGEAACLRIARIDTASGSNETSGRVIADDWAVDAKAIRPMATAGLASWAEFKEPGGERFPGVLWRPGKIHLALTSLSCEQADPAVFSVAWAKLFDRARLPEPEVVGLLERRSSGPVSVRAPRGVADADAFAAIVSAAPWCALLASLLVLVALALSGWMGNSARSGRKGSNEFVRSTAGAGLG